MKKWGALILILLSIITIYTCQGPDTSAPSADGQSGGQDPEEPVDPSLPSVKFISFGDWGTGDSNQSAVAAQSQQSCQTLGCDFALLLGDNFYPTGVSSAADPQWQSKYTDVYSSLHIPFYASLGNHDWDAPAQPQAQIDYALQDSTWKMPAAYYTQKFPSDTEALLQVFVINSNDFKTNIPQQTWLSEQIAQSTAPWKIVAFHHPIYSNSASHPPDEKDIYPSLKPIICGKVDLMLSGHDHLFSHLRNSSENCGYDQLIIGTGGRHLYNSSGDGGQATILYTESQFGFGHFSLNAQQITLQFIRSDGQKSYSYQWQK